MLLYDFIIELEYKCFNKKYVRKKILLFSTTVIILTSHYWIDQHNITTSSTVNSVFIPAIDYGICNQYPGT